MRIRHTDVSVEDRIYASQRKNRTSTVRITARTAAGVKLGNPRRESSSNGGSEAAHQPPLPVPCVALQRREDEGISV